MPVIFKNTVLKLLMGMFYNSVPELEWDETQCQGFSNSRTGHVPGWLGMSSSLYFVSSGFQSP